MTESLKKIENSIQKYCKALGFVFRIEENIYVILDNDELVMVIGTIIENNTIILQATSLFEKDLSISNKVELQNVIFEPEIQDFLKRQGLELYFDENDLFLNFSLDYNVDEENLFDTQIALQLSHLRFAYSILETLINEKYLLLQGIRDN